MTYERLTELRDNLDAMREEVGLYPQLQKLWETLYDARDAAERAAWSVYRGGTLR